MDQIWHIIAWLRLSRRNWKLLALRDDYMPNYNPSELLFEGWKKNNALNLRNGEKGFVRRRFGQVPL